MSEQWKNFQIQTKVSAKVENEIERKEEFQTDDLGCGSWRNKAEIELDVDLVREQADNWIGCYLKL